MADNPTPPGGGQRMQRMIQPTPLTGAQILWCAPPAKTQFVRKKSSMDLVMAPSNLDVLQSGSPMNRMPKSGFAEWPRHVGMENPPSIEQLGQSLTSLSVSQSSLTASLTRSGSSGVGCSSSSLPTVASAPNLLRRQSSTLSEVSRRQRFSPRRRRSSADALTPRTLAAHEERLLKYLNERAGTSVTTAVNERRQSHGSVNASDLSNPDLLDVWDTPTQPLPRALKPTSVGDELAPLSEADAMEVLRKTSACASLTADEMRLLLSIGDRRLYPRYALAMRETAVANGVFIVLQGKLKLQPARFERLAHERQAQHRKKVEESAADQKKEDIDTLGHVVEESMFFGQESLLVSVARMRTAVTLESTELLLLSEAQVAQLPPKQAATFRRELSSAAAATALRVVPFFSTLPESTRRKAAPLFNLEFFTKGSVMCKQGAPGDKMYVLLYGNVEVWRRKKRSGPRGSVSAPELMHSEFNTKAEFTYNSQSSYPWFGEVMLFAADHGRAGDCIATEDTLVLSLHKNEAEDFVFFVPGFKALAMSLASGFTVTKVKKAGSRGSHEDDELIMMREEDLPLKYGTVWARFVSRLVGDSAGSQISSVVNVNVQHRREKNANTMGWVIEEVRLAEKADAQADDEEEGMRRSLSLEANEVFDEQRRKMLERAHKKSYGETKTLAEAAVVGREWRENWGVYRSVRTELLRRPEFNAELLTMREKVGPREQRALPDTFPVPPWRPPTNERGSRSGGSRGGSRSGSPLAMRPGSRQLATVS